MIFEEEWRRLSEEFLNHYFVSNTGLVKHENRTEPRKMAVNAGGFPIVTLYAKDSQTRYLRQLNKLVANAFLHPPRFSQATWVWHNDGDLLNCHADNLRWETRHAVMEWNEMHRRGGPALDTPAVRNNRTGVEYNNAYECGMAEGMLETAVVARIERQARHTEDDNARYRYLYERDV